ncbi:hypothetical protein [Lacticigenium naphthae]|uniref:hypothetical protein n=1 Tax=Lacticigenium naphthae TaxID=515351 RepID=UPI00041428C1|nr:hypothetical protein [Lacticigenium naphthae]
MNNQVPEKITPKRAQMNTIRKYELLPEKKYRLKLFFLLIIDALIIFTYRNLKLEGSASVPIDINISEISNIIIAVVIYTMLFIGFFIAYCIVRNISKILKGVLGGVKFIINMLNPFYSGGRTYKSKNGKNYKKYLQEETEREKKQGKSEPFLYFRETFIGKNFRGYLLLLHVLFYLEFLTTATSADIFRSFNIYSIQFIVTFILYVLLSKEPVRTKKISEMHLKKAFKYYCGPNEEPLSDSEKETFDENFKVSINRRSSHKKGYFKSGIYHNQEFHYTVHVHVLDLKLGFRYLLIYTSNSNYEYWDMSKGIEILTQKGVYTYD